MIEVSIIVPCYNEEKTISLLLQAVLTQTFPYQKMEVIVADAFSRDNTRAEIEAFAHAHPDFQVRVVDNPRRTIPSALNEALKAATGEFIVRLDAHCVPRPDYVERCVNELRCGRAANVGGVWDIQPGSQGWVARSIAAAAAHPLGVGDAQYRHTRQAQMVDTVPFGSYRRDLIAQIGAYDESLLANEDYEFNVRVRQNAGKVWLDPAICTTYFARSTLGALARQYWRYGYWKLRMLRRYPKTLRWRQALPPAFVLGLLALLVFGVVSATAWLLFALVLVLYLGVLTLVGAQQALKRGDASMLIGVPLAIATMHLSWGGGFLWSMITLRG